VLLQVWSPDTSVVVRVLVNGAQAAGNYEVVWNGRDDGGALLDNGEYPYSLTATQVGGGTVLFESMLVASIHCVPIGTDLDTWGRVKALFRE
jgi:flagellar hook assembly protein FlgD